MALLDSGNRCPQRMLAVVVSDVEVHGEYQFERSAYNTWGSRPRLPRFLAN
jgi:hypothetical protein